MVENLIITSVFSGGRSYSFVCSRVSGKWWHELFWEHTFTKKGFWARVCTFVFVVSNFLIFRLYKDVSMSCLQFFNVALSLELKMLLLIKNQKHKACSLGFFKWRTHHNQAWIVSSSKNNGVNKELIASNYNLVWKLFIIRSTCILNGWWNH